MCATADCSLTSRVVLDVWPSDFDFTGKISIGEHKSPFGLCCIGLAGKRICYLGFAAGGKAGKLEELVAQVWPKAVLVRNPALTKATLDTVYRGGAGRFTVLVRGTRFQLRVWRRLLRIPSGTSITYGELAKAVRCPGAARAVGQAVGANPVAVLIPCHRVVRSDGGLGGYRWGEACKRSLLLRENADSPVPG